MMDLEGQLPPEWFLAMEVKGALEYAEQRKRYEEMKKDAFKLSEPVSDEDHDWTHHLDR